MNETPLRTVIPVRLSATTLERVRALAAREERPVSAMLRRLIHQALEVNSGKSAG